MYVGGADSKCYMLLSEVLALFLRGSLVTSQMLPVLYIIHVCHTVCLPTVVSVWGTTG